MTDFTSFMDLALEEAQAAGERGEVPVGAVVTDSSGQVLARAGNRMRTGQDPTAHAEILAIRDAAVRRGGRLDGCTLWVTLEPCAMCASALAQARIGRLVYGASDPKSGGVEQGARVFDQPQTHWRPEIVSGIGENASAAMIRSFFERLRDFPGPTSR